MQARESSLHFRYAVPQDIPALTELIGKSVRQLQAPDYSSEQREGSLGFVFGVDTQLIEDCTYFVAEAAPGADGSPVIAGCGGWSKRKTLFGSDHGPHRDSEMLDPATDAAKIRAIFVHPEWARRGVGSRILEVCETAASAYGFSRFQMGSTLTGVRLYSRHGYVEYDRRQVLLPNGAELPIVLMEKSL